MIRIRNDMLHRIPAQAADRTTQHKTGRSTLKPACCKNAFSSLIPPSSPSSSLVLHHGCLCLCLCLCLHQHLVSGSGLAFSLIDAQAYTNTDHENANHKTSQDETTSHDEMRRTSHDITAKHSQSHSLVAFKYECASHQSPADADRGSDRPRRGLRQRLRHHFPLHSSPLLLLLLHGPSQQVGGPLSNLFNQSNFSNFIFSFILLFYA